MEGLKEDGEISLNALEGQPSPRTMKMKGYIGKRPFTILIDNGSTHNFLDPKAAQRLKCPLEPATPITVTIEDGGKLCSNQQCTDFKWRMGDLNFQDSVRIIPLGECDMVLGVQWLLQVGPATFDYEQLTLQFNYEGRPVQLQGQSSSSVPELKMITLQGLPKEIKGQKHGFLVVVHPIPDQAIVAHENKGSCNTLRAQESMDTKLQVLLNEYSDIFEEPQGMPSKRSLDHNIPLKAVYP